MITVIGRFETKQAALEALQRFSDLGWDRRVFKLVTRDRLLREHFHGEQPEALPVHTQAGAGGGAAVGSVLGMIAGLTVTPLAGAGPLVAAGVVAATLASAATFAGVGAAIGSALGRRDGLNVVKVQPRDYGTGIRRGGALLCVRGEGRYVVKACHILRQFPNVEVWTDEAVVGE
jgi:hypothetical protein